MSATTRRGAGGKKIQDPRPKIQGSSKHQAPNASERAPGWILEFGSSLDLGAWCLDLLGPFSFRPFGKSVHCIDEVMELIGMRIFLPAATAGPRGLVAGTAIVVD